MVVCVLVSRFPLAAALGERRELLGSPVALAPEPGGPAVLGEVAPAAEAFGVAAGMRLGEALARCPELRLVPPDPEAVSLSWGDALDRLESMGAAVESDLPGEAYFEADGLLGLHQDVEGVMAAARRALAGGALVTGTGLGASSSRFAARVVALERGRRRRRGRQVLQPVVGSRDIARFLAPQPIGLLRARPELGEIPAVLEMLGVRTLGRLAALPGRAMSERFGHPGTLARDLALGRDTPLVPRRPPDVVRERLDLPEAASGPQLEHAVELLVARVLARRERRGRSLRTLVLAARFVEGGAWRRRVVLRQASADSERLTTALAPRLAELPAPAESISLEVEGFGPPARDQRSLLEDVQAAGTRRAQVAEAVRQVRQAAGEAGALRVLEMSPDSRLPERRALLAPYPVEGENR